MAIVVQDSFNRADSTTLGNAETGQTWKYFSGTFGVSGNQAIAKTATIHNNAFVDVGSGDYKISATFSGANFTGLVFKRNSNPATNDFYVLRINSSVLQLYRNSGGSFTSLSSVASTNNVGDILSVECTGTTIKFYQNGVLKGTVTDATLTANTGYGLYSSNNTTSTFDDFLVESLGTPTYTDGSTTFDTKQAIYNDSFVSSDTKQVIYSDSSVSFDTLQQIQTGGVDGSVAFNTKQTLYSDSSVQFDTKQGLYSDSQVIFNTKQAYYNDGFVSFDTLQVIEKIDWVDGSVSFDTQQLITETPKVIAQEVNLTFIAENEVNLSSEIENSVSLSFTI